MPTAPSRHRGSSRIVGKQMMKMEAPPAVGAVRHSGFENLNDEDDDMNYASQSGSPIEMVNLTPACVLPCLPCGRTRAGRRVWEMRVA